MSLSSLRSVRSFSGHLTKVLRCWSPRCESFRSMSESALWRTHARSACRKPSDNCGITSNVLPALFKPEMSFTRNFQILSRLGAKTHGDQELVQFLEEEIAAEKKSHKSVAKIEEFALQVEGAELTLTKKFQQENITVRVNVNHSVDSEMPEQDPNVPQEKVDTEMKSKPNFTVEIEKGGKTLAFNCSYMQDYAPEDDKDPEAINDLFNINDVFIYMNEAKDSTYSVSGEIIDGYLYDLLMNLLEERGISSEFVDRLSTFCTAYENEQYINLLEGLKAFVNGDTTKAMDKAKQRP